MDFDAIIAKDSRTYDENFALMNAAVQGRLSEQQLSKCVDKNILDARYVHMLTRSPDDEEVRRMLQEAPFDGENLALVAKYIFKNHRQLVKDLNKAVNALNEKGLEAFVRTRIYSEDDTVFLLRLMRNNLRFLKAFISVRGLDVRLAKIFAESTNEDVLTNLYNNLYKLGEEKKQVVPVLVKNPYLADDIMKESVNLLPPEEAESIGDEVEENLYSKIQKMTIAEKIKLAMKGNKSARNLLIRSPNKQISGAVIKNPSLTEGEVEFIAKNKNTGEHIFREIVLDSSYVKNYNIVRAVVFNAKAPLDITVPLINRLYLKDLEELSKSKDVSSNLRQLAFRMLETKKKK